MRAASAWAGGENYDELQPNYTYEVRGEVSRLIMNDDNICVLSMAMKQR
jgi:hypothetical protein